MTLRKERLHTDGEIVDVLTDALRIVREAEVPPNLEEAAFGIALQLRSQVAVSQSGVQVAHGLLQ